jgi:hypothetical protein
VDLGKYIMKVGSKWSWIYLSGTVFRRVRKIARSDYWLRHVCLSVRPFVCMEQIGSQFGDLHENLYLNTFGKRVEKIKFSLKSDENNVCKK